MTIGQWSTTAALNVLSSGTTGTGGINTDEGMARSDVNNAMRDIMAQVATWRTNGYFGYTASFNIAGITPALEVIGTTAAGSSLGIAAFNATAGTAGSLNFYRSKNASAGSATVVASGDALGAINWIGAQQTGTPATQTKAAQIRAEVDGTVTSGASGDMPGRIIFSTTADGGSGVTDRIILDATGNFKPNANDGATLGSTSLAWSDVYFAGGGTIVFNPTATSNLGQVTITQVSDALSFTGNITGGGLSGPWTFDKGVKVNGDVFQTTDDGGALGQSGKAFSDLFLAAGGVINWSAGTYTLAQNGSQLQASGNILISQTSTQTPGQGNNTVGISLSGTAAGRGYFSAAAAPLNVNLTADGNLVALASGGTAQGVISISGATTTYGAFLGSHWSQLADGSRPDILRGTICESIDDMCAWPGEPPEERLPKFKISDTPKSRSVYGIFLGWEKLEDWSATNDAYIAAIGAGFVRMAAGITPQRGDYIESNGDGCGKIQDDDILRASTVAKITSGIAVGTYEDGSRLYPATLHCG